MCINIYILTLSFEKPYKAKISCIVILANARNVRGSDDLIYDS